MKLIYYGFIIYIMPLIHELGHYIGYKIDGIPCILTYRMVIVEDSLMRNAFWGLLLGPGLNILLAGIFIILAIKFEKYKECFFKVVLIVLINRLLPYLIFSVLNVVGVNNIFKINDEGQIAELFNIPIWIPYIVIIFFSGVIIMYGIMKFKGMKIKKFCLGVVILNIIIAIFF